jgi:hypothetical protein|tara:strand:+ start:456 stop:881 length:426 start_codon:yes stop_codon:yes gene_type:complete
MYVARWFLAHSRQDDVSDIDSWSQTLLDQLNLPDWVVEVVPGRDDFQSRASALGGWKAWCHDVPHGCNYDGTPMFHGVVVPMDVESEQPVVGRATASIVKGFLEEHKHVFGWCPETRRFKQITALEDTNEDNWKGWSAVIF